MKKIYILVIFGLLSFSLFANGSFSLLLKTGAFTPEENFKNQISSQINKETGHFIIQFYELPTSAKKDQLKGIGIELKEYLPQRAFLVKIPAGFKFSSLEEYSVRSIVPFLSNYKAEAKIFGPVPEFCQEGADKVRLYVTLFDGASEVQFQSEIEKIQGSINHEGSMGKVHDLVIPINKRTDLLNLSMIKWIEFWEGDPVPEDQHARTLHRVHNTQHPLSGRNYDGSGVAVSLMDDGPIEAHIDLKGRITDLTTGTSGSHGDGTVGIVMGAGNLDPVVTGMAPAVTMRYYDYISAANYPHITAAVTNYINFGTIATSSSYSEPGTQGGTYSSTANFVDNQIYTNPEILHVFSAGNSASANYGTYNAPGPWGTITGGRKAAKSSIATGDVNYQDILAGYSSRGPAADGRIKPDICSYGNGQISLGGTANTFQTFGGTSAACPGITGTVAIMYQAFRAFNSSIDPHSGLIKAMLLNSADDLGNPGPDFFYGWGRVNALRAIRILENNQYLTDSVSLGDSNTHVINVPAGVAEVKVMVYWTDPAAAVLASTTLVNNIDIELENSSTIYSPWVLDHRDIASSLSANAVTGVDSVNNMEQVSITNPAAGTYTLRVKGSVIPQGPQTYYMVYEFRSPKPEITYPTGGESLTPGASEAIRWNATSNGGNFTLTYSLDSGVTWSPIASNLSPSLRTRNWTVPSTPTGNALIRIADLNSGDTSDFVFTIMSPPGNLNFSAVCTDSAELSWNPSGGALGYVVRQLGANYMDSIGYTTSTSFWVQVNASSNTEWFSVNAVGPGTIKSQRTTAIRALGGPLFNCPAPPIANFSAPLDNNCVGRTVPFTDESINTATSWAWTVSPGTHTFVNGTSATSQNPEIQFTAAGSYDISLDASNSLGTGAITKLSYITTIVGDTTRLNEDFPFNVAFPPDRWEIENPDGDWTWITSPLVIGSNGAGTVSSFIDNYPYFINGHEDRMIPYVMDLINFQNPILLFDLSNAERSVGFGSTLRVEISDDCGNTFQPTGYEKTGTDLATVVPLSTTPWLPTNASHWRTDTIDISAWNGSEVRVSFVNISSSISNNIFIDNIRIVEGLATGLRNITTNDNIKLFPIPAGDLLKVQMEESTEDFELAVYDLRGKRLSIASPEKLSHGFNMDVSNLPSGTYLLEIYSNDNNYIKRFVIE